MFLSYLSMVPWILEQREKKSRLFPHLHLWKAEQLPEYFPEAWQKRSNNHIVLYFELE